MTPDQIIHFLEWLDDNPDVVLESAADYASIAMDYCKACDPFEWAQWKYEGKTVQLKPLCRSVAGITFIDPRNSRGHINFEYMEGDFGSGELRIIVYVQLLQPTAIYHGYKACLNDLEITE